VAEQRRKLEEHQRFSALGAMLAGLAHEINNPLAIIVGQACLLQETARDEGAVRRAATIHQAADRCVKIVASFLSMAREEAPRHRPLDFNRLVADVLTLQDGNLRAAGVSVQLELPDELPAVDGDSDQLHQVLSNLITNAVQAMAPAPRKVLTLAARATPQTLELTVRDSGPGIPPALRERICEPFFTTKPIGHGCGLGLTVCRSILQRHGAQLALVPVPEGSSFLISFPLPST